MLMPGRWLLGWERMDQSESVMNKMIAYRIKFVMSMSVKHSRNCEYWMIKAVLSR